MTLRFHEIAEADHRILNPFSAEKLDLLGGLLGLDESMRALDLACGKGEMLTQWARTYGIRGVGVDMSRVFIDAAKERAYLMDVGDKVHFVLADAADYPEPHHEFDLVMCIGATWIGGGLAGTLDLLRQALKSSGGRLVVGEAYWHTPPPPEAVDALGVTAETFATLGGTLDRFEAAGLELVEMVLADQDNFDRYEAMQWMSVRQFLDENPDDPDAEALQAWIVKNRRAYLNYGRQYMGWGVFVLNATATGADAPTARANPNEPVGVEIDDVMLWVRLADGRVIGNPLAWYDWLMHAPSILRESVELHPSWLEWPDLGGQIRVRDLLDGRG